jgi:hypothetical protein
MAEDLTNSISPGLMQAEDKPSKNLVRDFFGIIHDPANTMQRVLTIGYWVGIFLVIIFASGALEQVFHNQIIDLTIQKMQEKAGENSSQIQSVIDFYQNPYIARPIYGFFAMVGQVVYIFILTVLYFFFGSVIFGGTAKFKQVWIVGCWSYVIMMIDMLVKTPLILIKNNIQTGINLGLIFSEEMVGAKLHNGFNAVDLFGIWHFIVAGLGLAILYKFTTGKGVMIAGIVWFLVTLVTFISGYLS